MYHSNAFVLFILSFPGFSDVHIIFLKKAQFSSGMLFANFIADIFLWHCFSINTDDNTRSVNKMNIIIYLFSLWKIIPLLTNVILQKIVFECNKIERNLLRLPLNLSLIFLSSFCHLSLVNIYEIFFTLWYCCNQWQPAHWLQ